MRIIGLSGRMQSGKTTVAEFLEKHLPYSLVRGFSSAIKSLTEMYFMDNLEMYLDLDKQESKSIVHGCGRTYRQILQEVGAKMRQIWPDIWIHKWKRMAGSWGDSIIIVPDCRFPNEVKAIQEMGGIVIRLTRNPVNSNDETETALDYMHDPKYELSCTEPWIFDCYVDNAVLSIAETNAKVLAIAKEYLNAQ